MSANKTDELEYGYEVSNEGTDMVRYTWWVKGPRGALHIWGQKEPEIFGEGFYGGQEVHYKSKPYDFSPDDAPIKNCWLTGCDCWPDGSSLYFRDYLSHFVKDHHLGYDCTKIMYADLRNSYSSYFGE